MLNKTLIFITVLLFANATYSQTAADYAELAMQAESENRYTDAITYFELASNLFKEADKQYDFTMMMFLLATIYRDQYQYDKALEYFTLAKNGFKELGEQENAGIMIKNIGLVYEFLGQYDKAIENYRKALAIAEEIGDKEGIGKYLSNIGSVYYSWGQYDKAIENFKKALSTARKFGDKEGIAGELNCIGIVYFAQGQYDKAIENYEKAMAITKEIGDKEGIANELHNIGDVYDVWGQYGKAIEYFSKSIAIFEEIGDKKSISTCLSSIGSVYMSWGQWDRAIENYRKALAIAEEIGDKEGIGKCLSNIGYVYSNWGQYDEAIENYRKALYIAEEVRDTKGIGTCLNNIGHIYNEWGQYDKAIENYRKALAIAEEIGHQKGIGNYLNNIGSVYRTWGLYDKAIENYKKALAIAEEIGYKYLALTCLHNIGYMYDDLSQYNKAFENYKKALIIAEDIEDKESIALFSHNIGLLYLKLNKYEDAADNLNKSIEIVEMLRQTAEGEIRRDYLASQIDTYQGLISTYIKLNKPAIAFNTKELSSAKYLIEQMGERLKEKDILFTGIENYREKLNENTAIINYSNINTWTGAAQIVVDKNNIFAIEVKKYSLILNINIKYEDLITNALEDIRGIKIKGKDALESSGGEVGINDLDEILNYYHLLLSKSTLSSTEEEAFQYIGKELYNFLFGSIQEQLEGKDELIIIPDGVLAFLPFETLIMPDGRYLIEKYHIKYTQSLTVSEIIAKRHYSENRKSLLAFGGAVYDELSYETDIIKAEKQLENLKKETWLALNRGQSTRKAYANLGLIEWDNLPGTLAEVQAIQSMIEGSDIHTGKSVDESSVKSLSENGDFREYKVLHFATHGLVVPEIPELSALVLSLSKEEENNEDGYLTMKEIAALDINADFVNLSACETGLGKIYGGEGVVGLTQSFLIAGANGLSVSLWQVADESTMKFMIGVYKLVQEKGMSYDRAITEMKRAFINGAIGTDKYDIKRGFKLLETDSGIRKPNKYSSPFYWAPFVYYGE